MLRCFDALALCSDIPSPHPHAPPLYFNLSLLGADFWEGDATKQFSAKQRGFSEKRETGKEIQ